MKNKILVDALHQKGNYLNMENINLNVDLKMSFGEDLETFHREFDVALLISLYNN